MKVILIDTDTVRTDGMSCYGHEAPTTPNLERLCRRGFLFYRVYFFFFFCVLSWDSRLSGRFGACTGCVDFSYASQYALRRAWEGSNRSWMVVPTPCCSVCTSPTGSSRPWRSGRDTNEHERSCTSGAMIPTL
jgi:hypothetical protein